VPRLINFFEITVFWAECLVVLKIGTKGLEEYAASIHYPEDGGTRHFSEMFVRVCQAARNHVPELSLLHIVQTGSEAHPASFPIEFFIPGVK
jgi:hypothetical protein